MKICETIQTSIAAGDINTDVSAHLRICPECTQFAKTVNRLLACPLPSVREPSPFADAAIHAAAARAAKHASNQAKIARIFRIYIPAVAALAVCFLFYFDPMDQKQPLSVPTHATVTGDWTGAVLDGEIAQVSMEVKNSISTLSLSDSELLLSQLEADFAAYSAN